MAKLFVMFKGLPGCGKSTVAQDMVNDNQDFVIVERDSIRENMGILGTWSPERENEVTEKQKDRLHDAMMSGYDVISSDTNFNPKCETLYRKLCQYYGYILHTIDMSDVPIETCIAQDALRTGPKRVGEKVIRDMARRYSIGPYKDKKQPAVPVTDPQDQNLPISTPNCIIVDLDGTVAKMVDRGPYDFDKVGHDEVRWHVVNVVKALYDFHNPFRRTTIVFLSGRDDCAFDDTLYWLIHEADFHPKAFHMKLLMRKTGDKRRDSIVKNEIFDEHIRGKYNVLAAFDDRDQVIRECWLPKGLPVFNVGDGSIF
jgi:predicted kinase